MNSSDNILLLSHLPSLHLFFSHGGFRTLQNGTLLWSFDMSVYEMTNKKHKMGRNDTRNVPGEVCISQRSHHPLILITHRCLKPVITACNRQAGLQSSWAKPEVRDLFIIRLFWILILSYLKPITNLLLLPILSQPATGSASPVLSSYHRINQRGIMWQTKRTFKGICSAKTDGL